MKVKTFARREELERELRNRFPTQYSHPETSVVPTAFNLAEFHHADERRKSGENYFEGHVAPVTLMAIEVAERINPSLVDERLVCAALCHDVLEKYKRRNKRIWSELLEGALEKPVSEVVHAITKPSSKEFRIRDYRTRRRAQNQEYLKRMEASEHAQVIAVIKFADRLHNIATLEGLRERRQIEYLRETTSQFIPFFRKYIPEELIKVLEKEIVKQRQRIMREKIGY